MFTASDVKFYLSGGEYNRDPDSSLGGEISGTELGDHVNNLFSPVPTVGGIFYRCIYVVNGSDSVMTDTTISVNSEHVTVGVADKTEVQQIRISGFPVGGDFVLNYTGTDSGVLVSQDTDPINFTPDPEDMAQNIQTALNDLDLLGDVTVSSMFEDSTWLYDVTFGGSHAGRAHDLLTVVTDDVLGSTDIDVIAIVDGNPINAVAASVGFDNQSPDDVSFSSSVVVGILHPLDSFAVWLRRETDESGEVSLRISAQVSLT